MKKTYFLDWMGTIGYVNGKNYVSSLVNRRQHNELLTKNLEDTNLPEELKHKISIYLRNEKHYIYPDSEDIINFLKLNGNKICIVSNMYQISANMIRETFPEFIKKFDVVTFSGEANCRKPQHKIFIDTLTRLRARTGICIPYNNVTMIGDEEKKDIIPSKGLGMQSFLINREEQTLEDLIKNGRRN